MKKTSSILWGLVLIAAGVILALNAMDVANIELFFDGWWTLFIIVPCTVGLFTEREKVGNIIGIAVGVLLLLCAQEVLRYSLLFKLIVPVLIVLIGAKMIFKGIFGGKANEMMKKMKAEGKEPRKGFAAFSGCDLIYDGDVFDGAELSAIFGGVKCDLRNAVIEKDCAVRASAIFGGIDILVSDNVNVKVDSSSIFGGVSNKTAKRENAPTVYISATCMFGGVDIK